MILDRLLGGAASNAALEATESYIPALDGLRAIAVLLVFGVHGLFPNFRGGFFGVNVFFVLSGFLITQILLRQVRDFGRVDLKGFYLRRAARLFPALVCMTFFFSLILGLHSGLRARFAIHETLPALTYISNFTLPFGFPIYLGQTWTLAIEEQFYLTWPLCLIALVHIRCSRRIVQIILLLALSGTAFVRYGNYAYGGGLFLGCAFAISQSRELRLAAAFWPLGAAGLLIAAVTAVQPPHSFSVSVFVDFCAAILIAACVAAPRSALARVLSVRPLQFLGRISYGLYLWHYPFTVILGPKMGTHLSWIVILPATLTIASVSYYLIERPILTRVSGRIRHGHNPPRQAENGELAPATSRAASAALTANWYPPK